MTILDTNILVYAHRNEMPFHDRAVEVIKTLAEGEKAWGVTWPSVHEFLSTVTNSRVFKEPSAMRQAFAMVLSWTTSPTFSFIGETDAYLPILQGILVGSQVTGPKVHDARIAAICVSNGVTRLFTADRDFSRFAVPLHIENPLVRV